jgi:hypothetical protein
MLYVVQMMWVGYAGMSSLWIALDNPDLTQMQVFLFNLDRYIMAALSVVMLSVAARDDTA